MRDANSDLIELFNFHSRSLSLSLYTLCNCRCVRHRFIDQMTTVNMDRILIDVCEFEWKKKLNKDLICVAYIRQEYHSLQIERNSHGHIYSEFQCTEEKMAQSSQLSFH